MKKLFKMIRELIFRQKEKKPTIPIDQKFLEQKIWFIKNMPRSIVSRADEQYCRKFIGEISDHFNPIELEEFPIKLEPDESTGLSNHFANLMQSYIKYRKENIILIKDFLSNSKNKLSQQSIDTLAMFLDVDEDNSAKLFETYTRLSRLLLKGSAIRQQLEKKK